MRQPEVSPVRYRDGLATRPALPLAEWAGIFAGTNGGTDTTFASVEASRAAKTALFRGFVCELGLI